LILTDLQSLAWTLAGGKRAVFKYRVLPSSIKMPIVNGAFQLSEWMAVGYRGRVEILLVLAISPQAFPLSPPNPNSPIYTAVIL